MQEENVGNYDFAFVDADKENYWKYHERLMKLVKVGGIVVYDNTLWKGMLTIPEEQTPEPLRPGRRDFLKFNKSISDDSRVRISHVPLGDGMIVCKRVV